MALASGILDTGVTWEIKDKLAMLLERLTGEDLGEQICRIGLARPEYASAARVQRRAARAS